jgi:hypothetical protein
VEFPERLGGNDIRPYGRSLPGNHIFSDGTSHPYNGGITKFMDPISNIGDGPRIIDTARRSSSKA